MEKRGDRRLLEVVYKDLAFDYSANLNIATFIYACARGLSKGFNWSCVGVGLVQLGAFPQSPWYAWFAVIPFSFVFLVLARLSCEGYANKIRLRQSENIFYKSNTPLT